GVGRGTVGGVLVVDVDHLPLLEGADGQRVGRPLGLDDRGDDHGGQVDAGHVAAAHAGRDADVAESAPARTAAEVAEGAAPAEVPQARARRAAAGGAEAAAQAHGAAPGTGQDAAGTAPRTGQDAAGAAPGARQDAAGTPAGLALRFFLGRRQVDNEHDVVG